MLSAILLLAAVANGHMLMNTPVPYGSPALVNGPLEADGSNFPCQLTSGETLSADGASNTYALGSTQSLAFTGQAVHGGGSCQISLTYDTAPSASSTWKVIRSIEGGCPAEGQTGNMGDDASAADPYTYNFTLPDDIPTGDVTLAWTWFNKIGNREMYMNCAPVTLTGTSGSESNFDSLPDMFTANIGGGCGTVDSADLLFPNPGSDLIQLNGATSAFSTPTGTACQAASSGSAATSVAVAAAAGSSTTAAAAAATSAAASSAATSAAATTAAASSSATIPGGVFVTVSTSAAAAATTAAAATSKTTSAAAVATTAATTAAAAATTSAAAVATTAETTAAAAATTSAAATAAATSSTSTGTEETVGAACTTEGEWNCLGSSYQRCASGVWSAVMDLASGTICVAGESSSISIESSTKKRRAVPFRA